MVLQQQKGIAELINTLEKSISEVLYWPILAYLFEYLPDASKSAEGSVTSRIAEVMDKSNYLVSLTSPLLKFTCVNNAWTRATGWSFSELTTGFYTEFIHPDDVEKSAEAAIEAAKAGEISEKYHSFTNRYKKKAGGFITVDWFIFNEFDVKKRLFISIAKIREE